MALNLTTLFTRWGKMLHALNTLNGARLTTVPDEVQDVLDEFAGETAAILSTVDNLPDAIPAWQSSSGSIATELQQSFRDLLVQMVKADNPQPSEDLLVAFDELLTQMEASGDTVDASTVTGTATADAGNAGTGAFLIATKRGNGKEEENLYAEDIRFDCGTGGESANFSFAGEAAADYLSEQWPDGSGSAGSVSALSADTSLVDNGGFEDEDDVANFPDDWILVTGVAGTTIKITDPEVQTVIVSGSPTAGTYVLHFTNVAGKVQTTVPLDFDADEGSVQSALNALAGADGWTVSSTGTSPNYTHTISMLGGPGGNVPQLTSTASTTFTGSGGAIAHTTTTQGQPACRGSKALEFVGGATLNVLQLPISPTLFSPSTSYGCNVFAAVDVAPISGTIRVCLWDGSAVVNDDEGTANTFNIDCTGLTTSFASQKATFRTPAILPTVLYLRIETTVAIPGGSSVYLDELAMDAMTALYEGGPSVLLFSGGTNWEAGDGFTLAMTNDRAGGFQTGVLRMMQSPERLLPSNNAGAETISDGLIS